MASCASSAPKSILARLGTVYVSRNRSIFANLAFEEWVFRHHNLEKDGDALLLWSNDPAVVVGTHQNPWLEVNIPFLEANGISLARRHSGGGTVYHDHGNLNVSLLTTHKQHCRPRNLRRFAESLNRHFGVEIVPNERDDMILQPGDRKVSGTAARIARGRAYHHFTLLVDVDLPFLKNTLKSPWVDRIQTNATRSVPAKAVGYLGQEVFGVTVDEVESVVVDTFRSSCEKSSIIETSSFTGAGDAIAKNEATIREWSWIFGKTPKFTIELADGRTAKVEKGIITEVNGNSEVDIVGSRFDHKLYM
uniref:BPL/LPL catalytic domain-containing protein n=1 Tax=Steinernema glaseri TaxID=37863 RepID=A0A1I7Y9E1_9BILA